MIRPRCIYPRKPMRWLHRPRGEYCVIMLQYIASSLLYTGLKVRSKFLRGTLIACNIVHWECPDFPMYIICLKTTPTRLQECNSLQDIASLFRVVSDVWPVLCHLYLKIYMQRRSQDCTLSSKFLIHSFPYWRGSLYGLVNPGSHQKISSRSLPTFPFVRILLTPAGPLVLSIFWQSGNLDGQLALFQPVHSPYLCL